MIAVSDGPHLNTPQLKSILNSEINVPLVVITGDHDQIASAKENAYRLKDSIANSQLIEQKNTGHEIPQTHPESISTALSLIRSPVAAVMR